MKNRRIHVGPRRFLGDRRLQDVVVEFDRRKAARRLAELEALRDDLPETDALMGQMVADQQAMAKRIKDTGDRRESGTSDRDYEERL